MLAHAIWFYKRKSRHLTTLVFWCVSGCVRQDEQTGNRMSKMGEGATFPVQLMRSYRLEEMLTKEEMLPLPGLCDKKLLTELCWVTVARFQIQLFHKHGGTLVHSQY